MKFRLLIIIAVLVLHGLDGCGTEAGVETLLVIEPSAQRPRNSEGDIVELKDGRLCLVYTRFRGGGAADHSPADLVMRTSPDNGKTWGEDKVLVANEGKCNVMSVSILRLKKDELLLFYMRKENAQTSCQYYVRRSKDEFETLSEAVRVSQMEGYHVVNNDRVMQLKSGRIIVPANLHSGFDETGTKVTKFSFKAIPFVYYSDDEGKTWQKDNTTIVPTDNRTLVLQENGVVELKDGRVWMYMRTLHDYQYGCFSTDGGINWSKPEPTNLAAPCSPATIKRIPWTGDLLCVWNDHSGEHPFPPKRRTPLCVAYSKDDGKSWSKSRVLEADPDGWYCYTSMSFVKDRVIFSYCAGDKKVGGLNRLKVVALTKDWIYGNEK